MLGLGVIGTKPVLEEVLKEARKDERLRYSERLPQEDVQHAPFASAYGMTCRVFSLARCNEALDKETNAWRMRRERELLMADKDIIAQ
jgi:hypothetical protein